MRRFDARDRGQTCHAMNLPTSTAALHDRIGADRSDACSRMPRLKNNTMSPPLGNPLTDPGRIWGAGPIQERMRRLIPLLAVPALVLGFTLAPSGTPEVKAIDPGMGMQVYCSVWVYRLLLFEAFSRLDSH
ncbi:hypothetical protein KZZ52_17420 [Dactylosporangium sp. AC04546]|uniref:hypothetical protein n=1 Tax=Dactylosporangium sp. AC04546 TaxID=2862460 RepID=UPI001EE0E7F0|nr:hypothetical protein [Dactylosporangium sp. AC04546]WVK87078.1 hypothetical protein KZZ52_17420 [Dactylosporangium sp. AC04546]